MTFRVEADPTSETPALDVVKATWTVTTPTPDLAIRADNSGAWLGENVRNADGANQTLERLADSSHVVRGQIKLSVANAQNGQVVTWSVPDWDAFRADGWAAKFFDAPTNGNEITAQITGAGWTTTHAGRPALYIGPSSNWGTQYLFIMCLHLAQRRLLHRNRVDQNPDGGRQTAQRPHHEAAR